MELSCAEAALRVGEPLAGTAVSGIDRWLVVEHQAPWGALGLDDSGLPEPVVARLKQLTLAYPRTRVQLVRGGPERPAPRLILAETDPRERRLYRGELPGLDALLTLPLEGWLRGDEPAPLPRVEETLFLVCVHGKRDRCCARLGLPVQRALEGRVGARALQTTHLGGHRFAATLLVLPSGLCYGRVDPGEVPALVEATERDEIYDLARLRGRTAYTCEAQAAEVQLLRELGSRRIDTLLLLGTPELAGAQHRVRFEELAHGRQHEVVVAREPRAPAPASCGAEPKPVQALVALRASASA